MMLWYGNGMGGWGYGLMSIGMVLFWALIAVGVVAMVRYGLTGPVSGGAPRTPPTPQQLLAERYARGEIDDEEFARRLKTLNSGTPG